MRHSQRCAPAASPLLEAARRQAPASSTQGCSSLRNAGAVMVKRCGWQVAAPCLESGWQEAAATAWHWRESASRLGGRLALMHVLGRENDAASVMPRAMQDTELYTRQVFQRSFASPASREAQRLTWRFRGRALKSRRCHAAVKLAFRGRATIFANANH